MFYVTMLSCMNIENLNWYYYSSYENLHIFHIFHNYNERVTL